MNELLRDLYGVQKEDFEKSGHVFGRAFQDDPAFHDIFKNISVDRRDAFFEGPARYCYQYGKIYATSPELEGMTAWLPGEKADMTFFRILRSGLIQSSLRVGMKTMSSMQPIFKPLEVARRRHMKGQLYNYVLILGVDPVHQGKGLGRKLLEAVIQDSLNENRILYLETATEKNVAMYRKFGFTVIDEVNLPVINIRQWCLKRDADLPLKH